MHGDSKQLVGVLSWPAGHAQYDPTPGQMPVLMHAVSKDAVGDSRKKTRMSFTIPLSYMYQTCIACSSLSPLPAPALEEEPRENA